MATILSPILPPILQPGTLDNDVNPQSRLPLEVNQLPTPLFTLEELTDEQSD